MVEYAPLWTRDDMSPSDRRAQVLLVCFASGPLRDDVALEASVFGVPSKEAVGLVDVREHARSADPEWFDGWRSQSLRVVAEHDLEGDISALDAADRCFTLDVDLPDAPDLGYLQAAWALSRWLVARGASVVLDTQAARYWRGKELPAVGDGFDIRDQVQVVFETDATQPDGSHVLHTRGLAKFARPDIVALCEPDDADMLAEIMGEIADALAHGFLPALPAQGLDIDDDTLYLVEDAGGKLAEQLGLNNEARILTPGGE